MGYYWVTNGVLQSLSCSDVKDLLTTVEYYSDTNGLLLGYYSDTNGILLGHYWGTTVMLLGYYWVDTGVLQ